MTTNHKVFTLLSGGVDSSTTLAIAREDFPTDPIECISVDYGQRHKREMECAQQVAVHFSATHHILNLSGLLTGMLVDKGQDSEEIPNASYADLPAGISPTYVSFRNGTMLSLLAARAQSWVMEQEKEHDRSEASHYVNPSFTADLYIGVHADDGARDAYPDCTLEFVGAMANAIYVGTYFKCRLRAPLVHMEKSAVVELGTKLGVPYALTWSCYKGEDEHCGVCPTCRARKEAFQLANVEDPTHYAA